MHVEETFKQYNERDSFKIVKKHKQIINKNLATARFFVLICSIFFLFLYAVS